MPEAECTVAPDEDLPRRAGHFLRRAALCQLASEMSLVAEDMWRLADSLNPNPALVQDVADGARRIVDEVEEVERLGWSAE